ncbi:hypothetical protein [Ornithinimicrobium kibberense]|uniref:hypothetical protein n=1 Tax=Ornithinimicrobium kibberense TaxID=282060 RepID=UPI003621B4F3
MPKPTPPKACTARVKCRLGFWSSCVMARNSPDPSSSSHIESTANCGPARSW